MKKVRTILGLVAALTLSSGAYASSNPECFKERNWAHPMCSGRVQYNYTQHRHHGHHRDWVAPTIIIGGAIIAAEIARQNEILREHDRINNIPPPPRTVIIERVERYPVCSEWREIQDGNGRIYRERTCQQ